MLFRSSEIHAPTSPGEALLPHPRPRMWIAEGSGRIAQRLERLSYTQEVAGSIPASPTSQNAVAFGMQARFLVGVT